jgi:hypothetical protein
MKGSSMLDFIFAATALTGITGLVLAMYLLPLIVGLLRQVPDIGSVAVINILLGWTLVGWAAAMALALRTVRTGGSTVQIVQHLPARWPLAALPPGGTAYRPEPPPLVLPPPRADAWQPSASWDQAGHGGLADFGEDRGRWGTDDAPDPGEHSEPADPWSVGGRPDPAGFGELNGPWNAGNPWAPGDAWDSPGGGERR